MSEDNDDDLSFEGEQKVPGGTYKFTAAGVWAVPAALLVCAALFISLGKADNSAVQGFAYLLLVLFGTSLGNAYTAKRVQDWKNIATERHNEVKRLAALNKQLVGLRSPITSDVGHPPDTEGGNS